MAKKIEASDIFDVNMFKPLIKDLDTCIKSLNKVQKTYAKLLTATKKAV